MFQKSRIFSIALLFIMIFSCVSCSSAPTYRDDVSASELLDELASSIGSSDMSEADKDFIGYYIDSDISVLSDYAVRLQTNGVNIDEIGVLKCDTPASAEAIASEYLKSRNDNWNPSYLAEERPKMEAAEYRTFGNYVVYAILSETDKQTVFNTAETFLKK